MSLFDGNLCCYKERGYYPAWGFSGGTPGFERPREPQRPVPECATRSLSIFNRQSAIGNSHVPVPTFFVGDLSRCYLLGMPHPRKAHDPALRDRAYPPRVSF